MQNFRFDYSVVRSARRTLAVEIKRDGRVIVRVPYSASTADVSAFLNDKTVWIEKHLKRIKENAPERKLSKEELELLKKRAEKVFSERVAFYAKNVNVDYAKITVKAQKTLWGSCSKNGTLSFNCLLLLASTELIDYVIVHELCHRKQMNHSYAFWREVERVLPDYKSRRKKLKDVGSRILALI